MTNGDAVEFVIQETTLDGKPFRPSDWAYRFLVNFAKDNELQVRATKLGEMQRVGDTA